jgi:hypothetical protein
MCLEFEIEVLNVELDLILRIEAEPGTLLSHSHLLKVEWSKAAS